MKILQGSMGLNLLSHNLGVYFFKIFIYINHRNSQLIHCHRADLKYIPDEVNFIICVETKSRNVSFPLKEFLRKKPKFILSFILLGQDSSLQRVGVKDKLNGELLSAQLLDECLLL